MCFLFFLSVPLIAMQMAGVGGSLAGYKTVFNKMSPFTMKDVYGRCSVLVLNEPLHDKNNKMICAPSEDSDQPGHPPSLIRVIAVHSVGS